MDETPSNVFHWNRYPPPLAPFVRRRDRPCHPGMEAIDDASMCRFFHAPFSSGGAG